MAKHHGNQTQAAEQAQAEMDMVEAEQAQAEQDGEQAQAEMDIEQAQAEQNVEKKTIAEIKIEQSSVDEQIKKLKERKKELQSEIYSALRLEAGIKPRPRKLKS